MDENQCQYGQVFYLLRKERNKEKEKNGNLRKRGFGGSEPMKERFLSDGENKVSFGWRRGGDKFDKM